MRKLTRKEKERYIALFEDEEYRKMLESKKREKWFVEMKETRNEDEFEFVLWTDSGYEDEVDELCYLAVFYARSKGELRGQAIDYQRVACERGNLSYGELYYFSNYFEYLGKRYGLLKEFRENGICQGYLI